MSFPSSDHIAEIMTFSQQYRRAEAQRIFILCVLGALLCAAFLLDLPAGQSSMPPIDTVRGLFAQDQLKLSHALILWQMRLPDALIALTVGASLGPACIETLTVLNNALAKNYRVDAEGKHDPSSRPLIEIHNPLKKEIIHEKVCC